MDDEERRDAPEEPEHAREEKPERQDRDAQAEERRQLNRESERHFPDVKKALLGDEEEPKYPDDADTR